MSLKLSRIGASGGLDLGEELRTKQARNRWCRFERPPAAEYFAAVVPGDPHGGDSPGLLVHIEIRGVTYVDAPVGEVDRTLRVTGKPREKVASNWDHLVALVTQPCHAARQNNVLRISEHAAEGIAGKHFGLSLMPCPDHPAVQPPGQRHS